MGVFDDHPVVTKKYSNSKRRSSACFAGVPPPLKSGLGVSTPTDPSSSVSSPTTNKHDDIVSDVQPQLLKVSSDVGSINHEDVVKSTTSEGQANSTSCSTADASVVNSDGPVDSLPCPTSTKIKGKPTKAKSVINPAKEHGDIQELYPKTMVEAILCVGCDEAGRGSLIGPVVSAAALWVNGASTDHLPICDSKALVREEDREQIHDSMMNTPGLIWAAAELNPETIDRMNILNAALFGMSLATSAVLELATSYLPRDSDPATLASPLEPSHPGFDFDVVSGVTEGTVDLLTQHASSIRVQRGRKVEVALLCDGDSVPWGAREGNTIEFKMVPGEGGHVPQSGWLVNQWHQRHIGIRCKACVKGDATHRSIASASIIAKVRRDRRMRELASLCIVPSSTWGVFHLTPDNDEESYRMTDRWTIESEAVDNDPYDVSTNKGYATPSQRQNVVLFGASLHHRLTFNPTLTLLKKNELKMPVEMAPRAFKFLKELERRAMQKEANKKSNNKKRSRISTTTKHEATIENVHPPVKKPKGANGQATLFQMFGKTV